MNASCHLDRIFKLYRLSSAEDSASIHSSTAHEAPAARLRLSAEAPHWHEYRSTLNYARQTLLSAMGRAVDDRPAVWPWANLEGTLRRPERVPEMTPSRDGSAASGDDRDGMQGEQPGTPASTRGARDGTAPTTSDRNPDVADAPHLQAPTDERQRALSDEIFMARLRNPNAAFVEQAMAEHASSVIDVILRKRYADERQRGREASKFVALILRTHGCFIFEHSARLIDLALPLAELYGFGDKDAQQRLMDGILYKDVGEVEWLLSEPTAHQRLAMMHYLAGDRMALCGMLHDIGKIRIPPEIMHKTGPLTAAEAQIMRMHTIFGAEILQSIPPLAHAAPAARHHHERYDGKGYPDGLKGKNIPLEARIIAIVDAFDRMTFQRPSGHALPLSVCRGELLKGRGRQFDPQLVEAFMEVLDRGFGGNASVEENRLIHAFQTRPTP